MARQKGEKYITCTFTPGMFDNEVAVSIEVQGTRLSLFADRDDLWVVDEREGKGLLRVMIYDPAKGLIALPSETLEQGRRFLRYPIDQLKSA